MAPNSTSNDRLESVAGLALALYFQWLPESPCVCHWSRHRLIQSTLGTVNILQSFCGCKVRARFLLCSLAPYSYLHSLPSGPFLPFDHCLTFYALSVGSAMAEAPKKAALSLTLSLSLCTEENWPNRKVEKA